MIPYQGKVKKLAGTSYKEVWKKAQLYYSRIKKRTKRKLYIRSAYFNKQKIFFSYFWIHLSQKGWKQKTDRLRYFPSALELIRKSRNKSSIRVNPNNKNELLYRFAGLTKNKELFFVQIKENVRTDRKYFMSVFSTDV